MIDTGSTRSFISPAKAYEYYSTYISHEPFEVISTHASSKHNQVIKIPLFPLFQSYDEHKFYLYSVDSRYDGLIGNDLLKQLEAVIDLKRQVLNTKFCRIPIIHNDLKHVVIIPPRSEIKAKLPTNLFCGEGILNYTRFCDGVRMPSALVKCENGYATTIIQNTLDKQMELSITKPFEICEYTHNKTYVNSLDHSDVETDQLLLENLSKLRLDHMNDEERHSIRKLCEEYKDIFYCDKIPLSFSNQVKHFIRTKNEDPIYTKPYRQAPVQITEINKQVDKLLSDNVIQESFSPWNSPVHLVPKKADASGEIKYRMVIDYRRLNEITVDDKYPLPNIADLYDKLGKCQYFSTLDLASGYHQIELNKDDRQKTAFSTQNGHYEFLRMPFGLKTAPATFQRAMNNVLRGLQGIHCLVYLDDVIIYSASLQEHIDKLRTVFDRLRQTNMKIQLDKSEFFRKEVLYLGHTITKDGLKPNDDKIKVIQNYPLPKTTTEIKSFLGLIGYYRKFIKDFAKITQPLTSCLKKRNKVVIDQNYIDSFQKCKEILTSVPLLQYPDPTKPYILTTDASNVALGAVLSQGPIGSDKPIAYASRTLSDTEARYSTIERELLAIIWAVKHFRPYLYGQKFQIYTDHRPLAWLYSLKEPNSKLTRWRLRLQEYDFTIVYKNGKQNTNADALSRIKLNAVDDASMRVNVDHDDIQKVIQKSQKLDKHRSKPEKTMTITDSDSSMTDLEELFEENYPVPSVTSGDNTDTIHSNKEPESIGIPILNEAVDTKPNQILVFSWFQNKIQVRDLSRAKQKVIEVFLPLGNEELIKQFLKDNIKFKSRYFIYFESDMHRKLFSKVIIDLFKKDSVQFFECTERVVYVEDEKEQRAIIIKHHEGKTCHRGVKETMVRIRRNYFWENMQNTVAAVLNACEPCKLMKYQRKPIKPTLQLTCTQDAPFQELFIDLFSIEKKYYLTIVDAFSKLGQAIEIASRQTAEVARALIKYFSMYGIPKKITSDPGTEFNNQLMRELLSMYKIETHVTTPNNPNSTGIIERFHSTIIEIYRLAKYEHKCTDAASVMVYSIMAYNHTIHSTTGLTPFEIAFGHTDSGKIFDVDFDKTYTQQLVKDHAKRTKCLYKYLSEKMGTAKEKVRHKKGGESEIDLKVGDSVFVKDINIRKSKDKPRYQKAKVEDKIERNIIPVTIGKRKTKVPLKNVKRPPQVLADLRDPEPDDRDPGPSTPKG